MKMTNDECGMTKESRIQPALSFDISGIISTFVIPASSLVAVARFEYEHEHEHDGGPVPRLTPPPSLLLSRSYAIPAGAHLQDRLLHHRPKTASDAEIRDRFAA